MISTPERLIENILKDTSYESMIREEFPDSDKAVAFKMRGIQFLSDRLSSYLKQHPGTTLNDYLRSVSIIGDEDDDDKSMVSLMTMHASKGLEWKVVILPDVNEGVVPHKKAVTDEELEEERRMFYVAMTRAKESLFIFYIQEKEAGNLLPSRFLDEIH